MTEPNPSKWSDLVVRTISALVLAPVAILSIWLGGYWFSLFAILLGTMMAWEWTNLVHRGNSKQFLFHAAAALIAGTMALAEFPFLLVPWVASIVYQLLARRGLNFWSIIGVLYVSLPILALMTLRADPEFGLKAIIWCFAIVWSADIAAYFAGRLIGGPKLAPILSPKKTWAGLIGAIVGAVAASLVFSYMFELRFLYLAMFAAQFAVLEQGGDILESSLKRHYNAKDSGDLIPGHGGVLDRMDGLIAVVVAAALIGFLHDPTSAAAGLLLW